MNFIEFINCLNKAHKTDKIYNTLGEFIKDYPDYNDGLDYDLDVQTVNYLIIKSKDKELLRRISLLEDYEPLDAELYFSKIDKYEDNETSFTSTYELKDDEEYYVEIYPKDTVYGFIERRISKLCLEKKIALDILIENSDANISAIFHVDECGEVKVDCLVKDQKVDLHYYIYLVTMLQDIFESTDNIYTNNVHFGDIEVVVE